jgi:hypothetical protein
MLTLRMRTHARTLPLAASPGRPSSRMDARLRETEQQLQRIEAAISRQRDADLGATLTPPQPHPAPSAASPCFCAHVVRRAWCELAVGFDATCRARPARVEAGRGPHTCECFALCAATASRPSPAPSPACFLCLGRRWQPVPSPRGRKRAGGGGGRRCAGAEAGGSRERRGVVSGLPPPPRPALAPLSSCHAAAPALGWVRGCFSPLYFCLPGGVLAIITFARGCGCFFCAPVCVYARAQLKRTVEELRKVRRGPSLPLPQCPPRPPCLVVCTTCPLLVLVFAPVLHNCCCCGYPCPVSALCVPCGCCSVAPVHRGASLHHSCSPLSHPVRAA